MLDALEEVQKLHPFIGRKWASLRGYTLLIVHLVAVIPFKAVCTLELKRDDNDQKTRSLYVEMMNMMTVLFEYTAFPRLCASAHPRCQAAQRARPPG